MSDPSGARARTAPERLHLAHVEGLRAVAALTVYVNHAYAQTWSTLLGEYPTGALSVLSYSLIAGHLAVSVFIVISGFCLALPVAAFADRLRDGVSGFLKRRAQRILPAYYGALALCLGLIATVIGEATGSLWDVPVQVTWVSVVSHLLLLQDLFATGSVNYVFWSIAVEWHLYFVFPLLVLGFRRLGPATTVALALVAGYLVRFAFDGTRVDRANPHFLGLFAMGMLGAYLVRSERAAYRKALRSPVWPLLALAALGVVIFLNATWGVHAAESRFHYLDLPTGIFAASLLVYTSGRAGGPAHGALSWKPLVAIGTFSYSVYLLHAPLLQLMWQYVLVPAGVSKPVMFGLLMTLGLGVVLAFSYAFFRVFEAPFLKRTGRLPSSGLAFGSSPVVSGELADGRERSGV